MPRFGTALPSAARQPAAARPCHTRLTQQPLESSAKERAPTTTSVSGERGASKGAIPGPRYGGRSSKHEKNGNPNTMQQRNNVCINELPYCCCTSLLRCCCTSWVLGWVGRGSGCCACCFCSSTATVVHHWGAVATLWVIGRTCFYGTFRVLPVYPSAEVFFAPTGAAAFN